MNTNTLESIDISKSIVSKVNGYKKPRLSKNSINARRVADNVIKQVGRGGKVVLAKAIREAGYGEGAVNTPKKITEQDEYKNAIASYESKLVKLRDKTINALSNKNLDKEKLYDVTGLFKVVDHSTALIQGRSTENVAHKSEIVVFGSEDFLSRQLNNGSTKPQ